MLKRALVYLESLLSLGLATTFQLVATLVLARGLGPTEFGLFSLLAATVIIGVEFSSFGTNDMIFRHRFSLAIDMRESLGFALVVSFVIGTLWTVGTWITLSESLSIGSMLPLYVWVDIQTQRIINLTETVLLSRALNRKANILRSLAASLRAISVVFVYLCFDQVLVSYLVALNICGLIMAALSGTALLRLEGVPQIGHPSFSGLWSIGFSQVARGVQSQIDRIGISYMLGANVLGIYSLASRLVTGAYLPLNAATRTMYSSYFEISRDGANFIIKKSWSNLIQLQVIGVLCYLVVYAASPYLSELAGPAFSDASWAARLLGLNLVILPLHYFASDILVAVGRGSLKLCATMVGIIVTIGTLYYAKGTDLHFAVLSIVFGVVASTIVSSVGLLWAVATDARPQNETEG